MFTKYARGMVYWANIPKYDINPNLQSGRRPVIIVSNNVANCLSNNITVVPCTTNTEKNPDQPTHYIMALNPREDSLVLCEDIITINKNLLESFMGMLDEHIMKDIDQCLKAALGLIDVPNHLLGNTIKKQTKEEILEEKTKRNKGRRVSGPAEMQEFINYYEQRNIFQMLFLYKNKLK